MFLWQLWFFPGSTHPWQNPRRSVHLQPQPQSAHTGTQGKGLPYENWIIFGQNWGFQTLGSQVVRLVLIMGCPCGTAVLAGDAVHGLIIRDKPRLGWQCCLFAPSQAEQTWPQCGVSTRRPHSLQRAGHESWVTEALSDRGQPEVTFQAPCSPRTCSCLHDTLHLSQKDWRMKSSSHPNFLLLVSLKAALDAAAPRRQLWEPDELRVPKSCLLAIGKMWKPQNNSSFHFLSVTHAVFGVGLGFLSWLSYSKPAWPARVGWNEAWQIWEPRNIPGVSTTWGQLAACWHMRRSGGSCDDLQLWRVLYNLSRETTNSARCVPSTLSGCFAKQRGNGFGCVSCVEFGNNHIQGDGVIQSEMMGGAVWPDRGFSSSAE